MISLRGAIGRMTLFTSLLVCIGGVAADPAPVPSGPQLDAAMQSVKVIYADRASKAKTTSDRVALAREVFADRHATSTHAERYAIILAALSLAEKGDDPLLLLTICDHASEAFKVDGGRMFMERVNKTAGPIAAAAWPALKERLEGIATAYMDAHRFDDAVQLATVMAALAKRARDPKAGSAAAALRKTVSEQKKARDRYEELAKAANLPNANPAAVLEFGRMLCFVQGDWGKGVGYLARSDDAGLAGVATAEARATSPEMKLAVADAWAAYADKAAVNDREPIRDHAAEIYLELIPELTGLSKVRAEKALDGVLAASQSTKDGSGWIVIFRSDNAKLWNTDSTDDPRNFAVPLDTLPSTLRFVRIRRGNGQAVIAPVIKQTIGTETKGPRYRWQGSKPEQFGAVLLGIIDNEAHVDQKTGEVALIVSGRDVCSGWGFGTRINHGTQATCWAGKLIPNEPLEIAVKKQSLSPEERKLLVE